MLKRLLFACMLVLLIVGAVFAAGDTAVTGDFAILSATQEDMESLNMLAYLKDAAAMVALVKRGIPAGQYRMIPKGTNCFFMGHIAGDLIMVRVAGESPNEPSEAFCAALV